MFDPAGFAAVLLEEIVDPFGSFFEQQAGQSRDGLLDEILEAGDRPVEDPEPLVQVATPGHLEGIILTAKTDGFDGPARPVTIRATEPLFDPVGIQGKVEVDDDLLAALKIKPFLRSAIANENLPGLIITEHTPRLIVRIVAIDVGPETRRQFCDERISGGWVRAKNEKLDFRRPPSRNGTDQGGNTIFEPSGIRQRGFGHAA